MKTYIGVDLGTSSIKLTLIDSLGNILNEVSKDYPLYQKGLYSEQNPEDWWEAFTFCFDKLLEQQDRDCLDGLSFSGQMHGLVLLDKNDRIIRSCILWNDGRSEEETKYLNEVVGKDKLSEWTGNIAYAGFTAPKLLWVKNHEKELFQKIDKIMLPKDYIAYRLTGVFATDYSDASGTLYLDVKNKKWSKNMLQILGISEVNLPKLFESTDVIGQAKEEFANKHKVPKFKVVIGAGDNAASAIGMGIVNEGEVNISLGTSGTIFIPTNNYILPKENTLHSFVNTTGKYHLMGCILSAASTRKWWLENVLEDADYIQDETDIRNSQNDDLYFLPYLSGERSPHNDVNAKGAFIGLTHNTTKGDMSKAILEGVAFALRDCLEIAINNGCKFNKATICGGGSKSETWNQIMSNVLNLPIYKSEGSGSFGAALLALHGINSINLENSEIINKLKCTKVYLPEKDKVEFYNSKYKVFRKLYPSLKAYF